MRSLLPLALPVGLALLAPTVHAQVFSTICSGQTGTTLQACLRTTYKPTTTYGYDRARDTLFAFVDDGNRGTITDVYAGRVLTLRKGYDPTKEGCNGDGDNNASSCNGMLNVNTEHAYPQSKGASSGAAQADMHHLYPARADVNSSRGNTPYGSFSNTFTSKYYLGTTTVACPTGCPPTNADTYSAISTSVSGTTYFMPRASVRGDLARSVFYFYTIYRTQADAADPQFFGRMKTTLRTWHNTDRVTADEQARSARVKRYQGKDNPFVLDTTLVRRAYFTGTQTNDVVTDQPALDEVPTGLVVRGPWPNPSRGSSIVTVEGGSERLVVEVYDTLGRLVLSLHDGPLSGALTLPVLLPDGAGAGVYLVRLTDGLHVQTRPLYVVP